MKAFEAGWGGVVTKTIGLHPVENGWPAHHFSAVKRPDTLCVAHETHRYRVALVMELGTDFRPALDMWLPDLRDIKAAYPDRMLIASIMAGAGSEEEMDNWRKLASAVVDAGQTRSN